MQGYGVLAEEILEQAEGEQPFTHAFVQAGVGGLAAAVAPSSGNASARTVRASSSSSPSAPTASSAQSSPANPSRSRAAPTPSWPAPCRRRGHRRLGRFCASRSTTCWPPMRRPPRPCACSRPARTATHRSLAGRSGCAATAGLIAAALDPDLRQALDLGATSRVLVIGSGATDPDLPADRAGARGNRPMRAAVLTGPGGSASSTFHAPTPAPARCASAFEGCGVRTNLAPGPAQTGCASHRARRPRPRGLGHDRRLGEGVEGVSPGQRVAVLS